MRGGVGLRACLRTWARGRSSAGRARAFGRQSPGVPSHLVDPRKLRGARQGRALEPDLMADVLAAGHRHAHRRYNTANPRPVRLFLRDHDCRSPVAVAAISVDLHWPPMPGQTGPDISLLETGQPWNRQFAPKIAPQTGQIFQIKKKGKRRPLLYGATGCC